MGTIKAVLAIIQKELKAPKGQFNDFGKYHYRSCEDILEAVKPLLGEAVLTISDDLVLIGERYYVKATAAIEIGEEIMATTAYAREEQDKKGMDSSQITGAASSYARKYALNGLFLIDDTKDADTQDNRKEESKGKTPPPPPQTPHTPPQGQQGGDQRKISEAQQKRWYAIAKKAGKSDDSLKAYVRSLGIEHSRDMPASRYEEACKWAEKAEEPAGCGKAGMDCISFDAHGNCELTGIACPHV